MAVFAEFYKHRDFEGANSSFTLDNNWRYRWIKFGGTLKNEISSFRGRAYDGTNGHVYGFTKNNFSGDYVAVNMANNWTCWWYYVGGALNDDIESAIMVNRNANDELVLPLADQIIEPFTEAFDEETEGTRVSRSGNPKVYSVFWPSYDSDSKFVRIEQNLNVAIDWWPDYDARVRFDVYLYLDEGQVRGHVAWVHTWVEGGIFTGDILDELHPRMMDGAATLTARLQDQLALINLLAALGGMSFSRLYLLPGEEPPMPPPEADFGHKGNVKDNATLVLTY